MNPWRDTIRTRVTNVDNDPSDLWLQCCLGLVYQRVAAVSHLRRSNETKYEPREELARRK